MLFEATKAVYNVCNNHGFEDVVLYDSNLFEVGALLRVIAFLLSVKKFDWKRKFLKNSSKT